MHGNFNALKYFFWTFLLTFSFWFLGSLYSFQPNNSYYMFFMLLGLMSPFFVALLMFTSKNRKDFIDKLLNLKRINVRTIPFLLLIMPFSIIVSICLSIFFGESLEQFTISKGFSFSTGFVPVLLLLFLAATFEELGWRGYGFESLEHKFNFFYASLIFSILWSAWHIPLVFVKDSYQFQLFQENIFYGINFYMSILPLGFIVSWVCVKNNKSIFIAIAFHFIINLSQEFFEITDVTKIIQSFVLVLIVACIILYDKRLFFKNQE